jgi:hypothetical protein
LIVVCILVRTLVRIMPAQGGHTREHSRFIMHAGQQERFMTHPLRVYNPAAAADTNAAPLSRALDNLRGKIVGFIDNAKPNFQFLVDDLEAQLTTKYGVKAVRKHRKPGQVPIKPEALKQLVEECDAVITGSGD